MWSHDQDLPLPQLHSISQFHRTLFPFIEIVYDNVWVKFQVIPLNIHWVIQETLQIHSICSQNCAISSRNSVTHYSQRTKHYDIAPHSHPNDLKFCKQYKECSLSVSVWDIGEGRCTEGGNRALFVKLPYMVIYEPLSEMAPKFTNRSEIYMRYIVLNFICYGWVEGVQIEETHQGGFPPCTCALSRCLKFRNKLKSLYIIYYNIFHSIMTTLEASLGVNN